MFAKKKGWNGSECSKDETFRCSNSTCQLVHMNRSDSIVDCENPAMNVEAAKEADQPDDGYNRNVFCVQIGGDGNKAKSEAVHAEKEKFSLIRYVGILLTLFSAFCYSFYSVAVKKLPNYSPVLLGCFRGILCLTPSTVLVIIGKHNCFPKHYRVDLVVRSILGLGGLVCSLMAVQILPLEESSVIRYSYPAFTIIIARFVLKEPCGMINIFVIILTMIGIVLAAKPAFIFGGIASSVSPLDQLKGVLLALGDSLSYAIIIIILRRVKKLDPSVNMFIYNTGNAVVLGVASLIIGAWKIPKNWPEGFWVLILGAGSFFGQFSSSLAVRYEESTIVAITQTSDIIFQFIWSIVFFNEKFNYITALGALTIFISVFVLNIKKFIDSKPDNSKRKFCCLNE